MILIDGVCTGVGWRGGLRDGILSIFLSRFPEFYQRSIICVNSGPCRTIRDGEREYVIYYVTLLVCNMAVENDHSGTKERTKKR